MKYLIAMDSFKGCLTAKEACDAAKCGILSASCDNEATVLPLADGGDGTAAAITSAMGGMIICSPVIGPFGENEMGYYGTVGDPKKNSDAIAIIDTASASGIILAKAHGLDPMKASTYGTGVQIKDMLDFGYRRIIVGLGGSGTNDGGIGALYALGASFKDKNGLYLDPKMGGCMLARIHSIDLSGLDSRLAHTDLNLMYDVSIPLTGEKGASLNYSKQKGATPEIMGKLEAGMCVYADAARRTTPYDPDKTSGAGAAGGLCFGLTMAGGTPVEGAPHMLKVTGFDELAKDVDIVITGEGKTDFQTASGKLPVAVSGTAKKYGKPVVCVCGFAAPTDEIYEKGIDGVFSIADKPMTLDTSMKNAASLIEATCFNIAKLAGALTKR